MCYIAEGQAGACDRYANEAGQIIRVDPLTVFDRRLAAGDEIHAVIRGTGLNNDGADKMSYTAPSVAGQAAVIAAAHRDAGVAAETISYIECHGTATPLGDPIEIAGLNRAFGAGRPGTVAIGSVKGNIGHLDVAAGIAGLIKTVQMLKAKEIAPVANFRSANPRIDFASGPFRVADRLEPWQSAGPRRAGISAFGVGGTNAHLVLEEAPEGASAGRAKTTRAPQVLPVSAASAEALGNLAGALATRLEGPDAPALADVAFTLQEGRRVCPHRFAVAATSAAEAAAKLRLHCREVAPVDRDDGVGVRDVGLRGDDARVVLPRPRADRVGDLRALHPGVPGSRCRLPELPCAVTPPLHQLRPPECHHRMEPDRPPPNSAVKTEPPPTSSSIRPLPSSPAAVE